MHTIGHKDSPKSSFRARAKVAAITFIVSFAVELWIALPQWTQTLFYGLPATASIRKLLPVLGISDAGSYLNAAVDLQDGSISVAHQWILNLWPPGMPVLLATMVKLGHGASPILPMVFVICILWSVVLSILAVVLIPRRGFITLGVFAVFWVVSPIFVGWTIHGGVLGSDGLATALGALVALGMIWASQAPPAKRPRWLLFIGLGAGLAGLAYLRIMWFYAVPAALVILAFVVLARVSVLCLRGRKSTIAKDRRGFAEWGALCAVFLLLCAPWTIYVGQVLHPGSYSWSQGDYQWAQLWMSDDYLESIGGGFLEAGGGNWPCDLDPQKCRELSIEEFATATPYGGAAPNTFAMFERDAFAVALTHPGEFLVDRSEVTVRTWLSAPGTTVGTFDNVGFGIVTLLCFIGSLVILAIASLRRRAGALMILLLLGANIAIIWLTHFETRYVVPLQAISLVVVVLWIATFEANLWRRLFARYKSRSSQTS